MFHLFESERNLLGTMQCVLHEAGPEYISCLSRGGIPSKHLSITAGICRGGDRGGLGVYALRSNPEAAIRGKTIRRRLKTPEWINVCRKADLFSVYIFLGFCDNRKTKEEVHVEKERVRRRSNFCGFC